MNKNTIKSIGAVITGIITVVVLFTGTDFLLESTGFLKMPFSDNTFGVFLLVVICRGIYTIAGGYVTATLAPRRPMLHAIILGFTALVLATFGAIAAWGLAPSWFLITLVALAFPCSWLGGKLKTKKSTTVRTVQ